MALSIISKEIQEGLALWQALIKRKAAEPVYEYTNLKVTTEPSSEAVSINIKKGRTQAERQASSALLSASLDATTKQDITEKIKYAAASIKQLTENLQAETNPTQKSNIRNEINSAINSIQNEFEKAVEENPYLSETNLWTAVIKPNTEIDEPNKIYSVNIVKAMSPEELGLTSLSFSDEDIESTIDDLETIDLALANKATAYESYTSSISAVVEARADSAQAEGEYVGVSKFEDLVLELTEKLQASLRDLSSNLQEGKLSVETLISKDKQSEEENNSL